MLPEAIEAALQAGLRGPARSVLVGAPVAQAAAERRRDHGDVGSALAGEADGVTRLGRFLGVPWDYLTSSRSSNMTSPSSVRCTGHLAAIVMSFSRCSSGSSLGSWTTISNLVGEPRCAGS